MGFFKYLGFFAQSFASVLRCFCIETDSVTLDIVLPVGISFYTFQSLGYTIDVYRRKIDATKDIVAFFAFVSFFPQLVAGPIERASNLLPQFMTCRKFDYPVAVDGMRQILWGLFKKMVVADNCAMAVDIIFNEYPTMGSLNLWVGMICFTFQIYGDFSGYSDIAIGSAKLFGIKLMQNFDVPYFSRNVGEFWHRWHISLSTWFRDYIYYPLGGSRCSIWRTMRNTMVVFLVSGLWHGAGWGYVLWGGIHGLLFAPRVFGKKKKKDHGVVAQGRLLPSAKELGAMCSTFLAVAFLWILFRSSDVGHALNYVVLMFTDFRHDISIHGRRALVWIMVLVAADWVQRGKAHGLVLDCQSGLLGHRIVRWGLYVMLFLSVLFLSGTQEQFIYFQF